MRAATAATFCCATVFAVALTAELSRHAKTGRTPLAAPGIVAPDASNDRSVARSPVSLPDVRRWGPAPAAEPMLLSSEPRTEVVSPAGVYAALCPLSFGESAEARADVARSFGEVCVRPSSDVAASLWITPEATVGSALTARIARYAELHRASPPMNQSIAAWLSAHGVPAPPMHGSVVFAAVSAVNYQASWWKRLAPDPWLSRFHGRRGSQPAAFMKTADGGSYAWTDADGPCSRAVLPTKNGGAVIFASIDDDARRSVSCLERPLRSSAPDGTDIEVPRLGFELTRSLTNGLARAGLGVLFDGRADPFPLLVPHRGLDEAVQSVDLQLDFGGISVKAGTVMDIILGNPRFRHHFRFDHPFAFRVVNDEGRTIALATIFDVPSR